MPITSPEEYGVARAKVAEYERQQAEERQAEEAAHLEAIRTLTNSPAYREIMGLLPDLRVQYRDDDRFAVFLDSLVLSMPILTERAGSLPEKAPDAE